ncbi:MAG: DUF4402 domain-containing protein, partial [Holophagaceae bacterium]|nr:DUF4402 domain-containing protein [Holophagaceae bacterium]
TLNRVGGGATMTVQVATPAFHLTNLIGTTTDPYTSPSFPVVGTLNVGANKLAGTYTANLSVPYNDGVGANTTTLTVTAVVIGPITIANTQALHFGTAVRGTVAGTIVLTPAGVRSSTGGVTLMTGAPLATPASFTVTGNANSTFAITLPASAPLTSGANSLNASAFTSTPSLTGSLSAGGTQSLAVGGTLNVAANQAEGDYAGTFNVTVAYN